MFKEEHMEKIKLYQLRNSSGFGVDVMLYAFPSVNNRYV